MAQDAITKVATPSKRGAKPGERRGGRQKGQPNKTTAAAKEALQLVFENLGGVEALETWVRSDPDNQKAFYVQVWPKLLPLQVNGAGDNGEHIHAIKWID